MTERPFLVDGSEMLQDAIERFASAVSEGQFGMAQRFAGLAFYLIEHQVGTGPR